MASDSDGGGRRKVVWVIGGVVCLGVLALGPWYELVYHPQHGKGALQGASVVAGKAGPRLMIHEEVDTESRYDRFTLVDPATGRRGARVVFQRPTQFVGAAGERLWFSSQDADLGMHARDAATLEVTLRQAELVARTPPLHAGVEKISFDDPAAIEVVTRDGHRVRIDAATLAVAAVDEDPAAAMQRRAKLGSLRGGNHHAPSTARVAGAELTLAGDLRRAVVPVVKSQHRPADLTGRDTFLDPSFVSDHVTDEAIVEGDGSVLVLHRSQLGTGGALRVSRVGSDGKARWTVPLEGQDRLVSSFRLGDRALLLTIGSDDGARLYALDPGGALRVDASLR